MKIRYPMSFVAAMMLDLAIATLAMTWSLYHVLGLMIVIVGVLLLPTFSRWERGW